MTVANDVETIRAMRRDIEVLREFAQWVLDQYHAEWWPEPKEFAREARRVLESTTNEAGEVTND